MAIIKKILFSLSLCCLCLVLLTATCFGSTNDERTLGDEDADVIIEYFGDFECPFCARWYEDTFPLIKEEFIDKGDAYLVMKHFPLPVHSHAQSSALASECAAEQDAFYEYVDLLFSNQDDLSDDDLIDYAMALELDIEDFVDCLDNIETVKKVVQDMAKGEDRGVKGTPSFFINGKQISGAQSYSVFESVILSALDGDSYDDDDWDSDDLDDNDDNHNDYDDFDDELDDGDYDHDDDFDNEEDSNDSSLCVEGHVKSYSCPDASLVIWCECIGSEWECISNPQEQCAKIVEPVECSQGCLVSEACVSFGQRLVFENQSVYCNLSQSLVAQLADGSSCQNNYECLSNQCSSGSCIDLAKELQETQGLLERVLDFFTRWF